MTEPTTSSAPSRSSRLPLYRRFGVKIVAVFMILILAALGASAYTSVRIAGDGFARVVSQDFQSTLSFSENYLTSLGRDWSNWVRHLTIDEHEHGFGAVIVTKDRGAIDDYINRHLATVFSGATAVLDTHGRVMYRSHDLGAYGDSLNHVKIVRDALIDEKISFAIVNDLNRFMLYAAGPIYTQDKLAGVLLIGNAIDDNFVQRIKNNTGVEIAMVRDRAVMGSTLTDDTGIGIGDLPIPYLEYQMMLTRPNQVLETRFLGQRYFVATQKLKIMDGNTPGSLFLAVPRKQLDVMEAEIYQKFIFLMLAIAVLTLMVGGVLTHRMSRPLSRLTEKANAIAAGKTDAKFQHISKDEIGVLATSFNDMQDALSEKSAELHAYSETLEFKVKERTTELEQLNEQFMTAKENAEEANRAKSLFLSSMSHELRTPLNAILGFGQVIIYGKDPLTEGQEDAVQQVLKGGEHLLELINEVLDLAQIESGEIKLDAEYLSPAKAIKQCLIMAESMAGKYNVRVEAFAYDKPLPTIHVDVMRFKQVLLNLLSNAVKYNRSQGLVSLKCEEAVDGMLRFNIIDTGYGIPEDMQDKLFTPFERMGRESSNIEGTGIGLNITKDLVELMGGSFGFVSKTGAGSTFWVEFPITAEHAVEQQTIASNHDDVPLEKKAHVDQPSTILYVEDNPANILLMEELIGMMENLELRTAHDAELGIAMVQGDAPDLILMDIHLPGMSGIEALRVLKESGETANIPVIAVSADAMQGNIDKAMEEGFVGYITKPFNLSEIVVAISENLKHKA